MPVGFEETYQPKICYISKLCKNCGVYANYAKGRIKGPKQNRLIKGFKLALATFSMHNKKISKFCNHWIGHAFGWNV
jgi:hypothetical protein